MTVEELVKELLEWPNQKDRVTCSVDCDSDDPDVCGPDFPRRVFGDECRGLNPSIDEAVILFDLSECTFKGDVDIRSEADDE